MPVPPLSAPAAVLTASVVLAPRGSGDPRQRGPHVLVTLGGDVDARAAGAVDRLRLELNGYGLPVVLDASAVTGLDAAGWSALRGLAPAGTAVLVAAASPAARRFLDGRR